MSGTGGSGGAAGGAGASGSGAGSGGSKVDAIWAQLKGAHSAPKAQAVNFNKLWHGFSSDVAGSGASGAAAAAGGGVGATAGSKRPAAGGLKQETYAAQLVQRASPAPAGAGAGAAAAAAAAASAAGAAAATAGAAGSAAVGGGAGGKPDPDTALQLVARCVAGLKDSSQAARRKALQDVQAALLDNPGLSESWLCDRLEGDGLGKALLRRFDDPADTSREAAVVCLTRLLAAAPGAVLSLLPYAFPVVSERVMRREEGSKNLTEPCEEVRLALARLLRSLVSLAGKSFGGYAGEAAVLVEALCEDPFHEVQEEACAVVVALNDALGLRLQPVAKQLVAALLPLTTAKRHRVRLAALGALRPTMHQGAHEMILEMVAWRDPNVIAVKAFYGDDLKVNFCGKLAADPHPAVRREFLALLGDWMTRLRERLDHESRLLPYVLSALNDESPEIQADAVALLDALGAQYEADHEKDLKETLPYLPEEAHGVGWQAAGAAAHVYGALAAGQDDTVFGGRAVFVLPGPLRCRPRLGTRRLAQSNFGRIVGALSEELTSWLHDSRVRSAALLRTQLVLVEEAAEQHLHLVLPAICRAISDPEVRPAVRDSAAIVGAFTDFEVALQLLGPRISDDATAAAGAAGAGGGAGGGGGGSGGGDMGTRAAALEALACVIRGAGPRRAVDGHLGAVLGLLGQEGLLCSEDSRVRRSLQEVVEQLVATCGPACGRHAALLLWVCLHLRAPGRAAHAQAAAAAAVGMAPVAAAVAMAPAAEAAASDAATTTAMEGALLPRLAEVCGYGGGAGGVDALVEAHRQELLALAQPGSSPNCLLSTGVLCRLMLPTGALSHARLTPTDDLLTAVLQPAEPAGTPPPPPAASSSSSGGGSGAAAMEVDGAGPRGSAAASAAAAAGDVDMQDGGAAAAAAAAASTSGQTWSAGSLAAVLAHLSVDVGTWLPRQPRAAAVTLLCLEAALAAELPATAGAAAEACDGAEAEVAAERPRQLAAVLAAALGAAAELPPTALLPALRCAHVALARGLLLLPTCAAPATAPGASGAVVVESLGELVARLGGCMAVTSAAACRLQACAVMSMLLRCPPAAAALAAAAAEPAAPSDAAAAGGAAAAALGAACAAIAARLYDAADEVRCAALRLVRVVVELALGPGGGGFAAVAGAELGGGAGGSSGSAPTTAVGRLVSEAQALRDVSLGSDFYGELTAFREWVAQQAAVGR
ncbi:hypothetical protein HYH02_000951 [Chlamydomonas schloesseri]|uniref:TOG domain-containing protein n=1 Tax=Chlamydomonas schloesseri TaxID=2026947 RepID=A0A835WXA8_9CHLO|nr:hypothetical protein HYH02_000951 [Chlamydomonas schloesseri]|eukprot:KAG2455132.1 hypothetical protein HYH02_000951 [Chlamydomonas schloesseri]